MLVNTLRKVYIFLSNAVHRLSLLQDLESDSTTRITIALNYLIQCPSEDVIPAVQERLHGLLSHKSCVIPFLTRNQWL
jgi:hypothetical protein